MQVSNLTLAYLLEEIRPFAVGAFVNKVQEIQKGIFKIKVHSKTGSKDLIVTDSALFFSNYSFTARQNSNTFFVKLRDFLSNKKISSITQHEFDRVAVIEFADFFLILELFHDSNAILADKEYKILLALHPQEWKDRSIKKGEQYKFPSSKGANPKTVTEEFLLSAFKNRSGTAIQELVAAVNISPLVAEEVFFEQKIDKKTKAADLPKSEAKKIAEKVRKFYSLKTKAEPVLFKQELLPFPFSSLKGPKPKESLFGALDAYYSEEFIQKPSAAVQKEHQTEINRLKFSHLAQQNAREQLLKRAEEDKIKADLIYGHFNQIQEIVGAVKTAIKKQIDKKEVMYKINRALAQKKTDSDLKIVELDFGKKELVLDIKND